MEYSSYNVNTPQWREITVGSHLPAELRKLAEIAHNLWWTWNDDVKKLYCDLDPGLWKEVEQNPVLFLYVIIPCPPEIMCDFCKLPQFCRKM